MDDLKSREITEMADFFKVFGDFTRMQILVTLLKEELCVQCLTDLTEVSQSAISHQLRLLKASGLVKARREGKKMYYSLDDEHIKVILEVAREHVEHKKNGGSHV
jgi:DNA-binding transcriptional ArsR family regulator